MVIGAGYRIEEIQIRTASDEVLHELFALALELHHEAAPEDPPPQFEVMKTQNRELPDVADISNFIARDQQGRLAGQAFCLVLRIGENEHMAQSGIEVGPEHRRQGLGRAFLGELQTAARAKGARVLLSFTSERVPAGAEFARATGAKMAQEAHENRLDLRQVDRKLVERWVAEGPRRAPGYSLVFMDGRAPDEMVERVCKAFDIMNTAPRGDIAQDDIHFTPALYREFEKQLFAGGGRHWALYASHEGDGEFVGFTDINWHPDRPQLIHQGATAVDPAHRGHALGKWLKAEMIRRVLAELPDANYIVTGNADSNDAMLGINRQLGFAPHAATLAWQLTLD